jgi:hypothetical protein
MNQFRNKDSGENSVCVRTLAWPIWSYRMFNIDLIVRSNDKRVTMNKGPPRSVDISAQIFQTVIWEITVPRIEIPGTIHKPARTADVVTLLCSIYWRNFHRNLYCGTGSLLLNMIHMTQFGGGRVLCVCVRERKNINAMHVCMFVCFLPSACAFVCMCVSFFLLYL